jgi:hypothetical protein
MFFAVAVAFSSDPADKIQGTSGLPVYDRISASIEVQHLSST